MNVIRYKTENLEQVIRFLQNTENAVYPSTEIFEKIGKLLENEPDRERLNKLFKKAYTVAAVEDGEIIGLASMDKEGYIGILAADNAKAQRRLLSALDKRAVQNEMAQLFVQPFEEYCDVFKNSGYVQMNEGDDFNLVKKFESDKLDLQPDKVRNITLDPSKTIIVEGKRSVFPFFFLGTNCFFMILLWIFSATYYKNAFEERNTNFIVVFIAFTLLFCVAIAIFIGYFVRQAKLKKQVLSMRITNGIITSFATSKKYGPDDAHFTRPMHRAQYTRVYITYVFYDENMIKREGNFTCRYRFSGPYFYEGQELVIACSSEKSYILNKYSVINRQGDEDETVERFTDLPEAANAKTLSAYVPIKATKLYYGYALSFLCGFVFILIILCVLGIVGAKYTGRDILDEVVKNLIFGSPFLGILGVFGIYSVSIPIIEKRKYRKLLESANVRCVKGKIIHGDKTYKSDNKMRFYCEFYDGKEKRRVATPYRSSSNLVKRGVTSVLVAFNDETAAVLVKKGDYPDTFSLGYYRN